MGGRYPATTRTQLLGGLSTWAHVLPLHELKHEEDARPTTTWTQSLGDPFVDYETSHSSDPLFTTYPGGMSVVRIHTNQMPPNRPRSHTAPRLTLRPQSRERNIHKSELDQKHANYTNYALLCYPSHAYIHNTNISHIQSSSPPNADCRFLLIPVGGIGSTCSFLQRSCLTLASMSTKDLTNLSHSLKFNATPFFVGYQRSSPETLK